jgi:hypothetical protein
MTSVAKGLTPLGGCPVGPRHRNAPEAATGDAEGVDRPTAEGAQDGQEQRSWWRVGGSEAEKPSRALHVMMVTRAGVYAFPESPPALPCNFVATPLDRPHALLRGVDWDR